MNPEPCVFHVGSSRQVRGCVYAATSSPAMATCILAHGAGAPQSHPFMVSFAQGLASRGFAVVTFDFPYMDARRTLPDSAAVLEACYAAVIRQVRADTAGGRPLVVGGKSMGGRIASQVVAHDPEVAGAVDALVFLGYPLHRKGDGNPSARALGLRSPATRLAPPAPRAAHLPRVRKPMLFVQGSRDAFGTPDELAPILASLVPRPRLLPVEGGDHSFSVPKAVGKEPGRVLEDIVDGVAEWIRGTIAERTQNAHRSNTDT